MRVKGGEGTKIASVSYRVKETEGMRWCTGIDGLRNGLSGGGFPRGSKKNGFVLLDGWSSGGDLSDGREDNGENKECSSQPRSQKR